ncbi:hypothetical protein K2X89_04350 [Myxococcota bacterium]|nr:hypothetical protein [Myxococcota bacterium]
MEGIASKYEILPRCRFGSEVRALEWNEARAGWQLTLASGQKAEAEIAAHCADASLFAKERADDGAIADRSAAPESAWGTARS